MLTLWFDGLFRSVAGKTGLGQKAGFLCYGWLISRSGQLIARGHGACARAKDATSNVAEYLALIEGLDALGDLGLWSESLEVRGDAKCVIDQMQGLAAVNSETMRPLYRRAIRMADRFNDVTWTWTPRRMNKEADSLTRRAMRQIRMDPTGYDEVLRAIDPGNGKPHQSKKFLPLIDLRVYGLPGVNGW